MVTGRLMSITHQPPIFQHVYYQDKTVLFVAEDIPSTVKKRRPFIGSRKGIASTTNVESPATSRPKKSSG